MKIGAFASENNMSQDTLRYYMDMGLIHPKKVGNRYDFTQRCQEQLDMVQTFKAMGFTLREIKHMFLYLNYSRLFHKDEVRFYQQFFEENLVKIRGEKARLERAEALVEKEIAYLNQLEDAPVRNPIGIPLAALAILNCPVCKGRYTLAKGQIENGKIMEGELSCGCDDLWPIREGILYVKNYIHSDVTVPKGTRLDYLQETTEDMLDRLNATGEWYRDQLDVDQLRDKIILEPGIGRGYGLTGMSRYFNVPATYIGVDHSVRRLRHVQEYFGRFNLGFDLVLIATDFDHIPLQDKSVDVVMDIAGSSNYAFDSKHFLMEDLEALMKDDVEIFGTYIIVDRFKPNHPIKEGDPLLFTQREIDRRYEAMGLYVLDQTGMAMSFAITMVLGTVPRVLVAPFAGYLADRWSRKRLVVATDLLNGFLLIVLYVVFGHGLPLWAVYGLTAALATISTQFDVALESSKPNLVSRSNLGRLNAIGNGIHAASGLVGPMLGGVVYAFMDFRLFVLVNGVSFVLSGISEAFIDFDLAKKIQDLADQDQDAGAPGEQTLKEKSKAKIKDKPAETWVGSVIKDMGQSMGAAIGYLKSEPLFLSLMVGSITINFLLVMTVNIPVPYYLKTVRGISASWIGIVQGGFAGGYLLGAVGLTLWKVTNHRKMLRMMFFSTALMASLIMAPMALTYLSSSTLNTVVWMTLFHSLTGLSISLLDIPLMTVLQVRIPDELRGRLFSFMMMTSRLAMPLAMILAGVLLRWVPPVTLSMVTGSLLILFAWQFISRIDLKNYQ